MTLLFLLAHQSSRSAWQK